MTQLSVLVVDDEPQITAVLAMKLRKAGFGVREAHDGHEALAIALGEPMALVITDLQMPKMDGITLAQRLAAGASTARVPVIIVTARGYQLAERDLSTTNIRAIIAKPFSPREVMERVAEILGPAGGAIIDAA